MSRTQTLLTTVGLAVAVTLGSAFTLSRPADTMVRFGNQLTESRTVNLSANGQQLYTDIASGTTTDFTKVTDTLITFTLRWSGNDSIIARTTSRMVSGASYTVSASRGMTETPTLSVIREPLKKKTAQP
jgi:hypothetical protein